MTTLRDKCYDLIERMEKLGKSSGITKRDVDDKYNELMRDFEQSRKEQQPEPQPEQ